jgi:hypothetical protein
MAVVRPAHLENSSGYGCAGLGIARWIALSRTTTSPAQPADLSGPAMAGAPPGDVAMVYLFSVEDFCSGYLTDGSGLVNGTQRSRWKETGGRKREAQRD